MRAAWFEKPSTIGLSEIAGPDLLEPADVIVDVTYAAICGSDLWVYRGTVPKEPGSTGHEFIGQVSRVGSGVTSLKVGDSVIAPFMYSCGSCAECKRGLQSLCSSAGLWGKDGPGAQAEQIRVPFADSTLVSLPWLTEQIDDDLARKLLPLADVFATGTHGATLAGVSAGDVVAIVGDGAVGISAAYASLRLGARRAILFGEQQARLDVAATFGVETVRIGRDDSTAEILRDLNDGMLADRVVECVGMDAAFNSALSLVRPGGSLGSVGVPHAVQPIHPMKFFSNSTHFAGGVAPARHYLPGMIAETRAGTLDVSALIDQVLSIEEVAHGYAEMSAGRTLKVMLRVQER